MTRNEYSPNIVSHPGETLVEKLEEIEMGAKELAIRTGKPEKTISAIISGKSSITPEIAILLEKVLRIPASFWIQRQANFNEAIARKSRIGAIKNALEWAKGFPYNEMAKLNWVKPTRKIEEKTENLFKFFGIASKTGWEDYFINTRLKLAFRISLKTTKVPEALSAWLRAGELQADKLGVEDYSEKKLKSSLLEIKNIMATQPVNFFTQLKNILTQTGVRLIFTPCLPKAPINGASRWHKDKPLVQVSCRHKKNDIFWFTLFHELGHLLLHGKKDIFLEDIDYHNKDMDKENEADVFARDWLLTEKQEKEILRNIPLNAEKIRLFAQKFNTHAGVIVGRLQHKKLVHYSIGRELIETIDIPVNEADIN